MWREPFLQGGGVWVLLPPKCFEKYTLDNAFWRHIYTELRNQAISQVIISRD